MRLARGSLPWIIPFFLPILLVLVDRLFLIIAVPSVAFGIFQIWFFRDPSRDIEENRKLIYAPADGTVLYGRIFDKETTWNLEVGIRMSPFDVHIIRAPINFEINQITHKPGGHKSVYLEGAEKRNEQKRIQGSNELGDHVELLLITGAFARRIDLWVTEGQQTKQGDKLGIIRFGSQTNIQLTTKSSLTLLVGQGDKVKAGLTPIARIE